MEELEEFNIIVENEEPLDVSMQIQNDFIRGEKGQKGDSNTLVIGTVEKGEEASASITGESPNQVLNLVLPKGDIGEKGEEGYTPVKGTDYFTEAEIQQIKQDILNDVSSFDLLVVDSLPTENIQEKTIYLTPNTETEENNVYDEYIYVNGKWEVIGSTAVDTDNLTVNLVENSYDLTLTEAVAAGGTITLPSMYKVGFDRLDVYLNGEKLIKAETSDTEGHYYEVGTEGTLSNVIRITSDWTAEVGDVFEFSIRTNGEGEGEEIPVDTVPIGSIFEYEGNTPPDGFEEVAEGEIYSTAETRIGTWIDGKPLYRKVYVREYGELVKGHYINEQIDLRSWNIKELIKLDGSIMNTASNQMFPIHNPSIGTWYNGTDNYMLRLQYTVVTTSSLKFIAILEYTKTTD